MAERTDYLPGTFCWTDLGATDQDAAKAFYTALFGWEAEDMPVGDEDGTVYSMMRVDGSDVAAIAPQPPQQREMGAPPAWNSYVSVASADDAAARAAELGATVAGEPFDVLDAGRMAVIQDPQGAVLMLWEPRRHHGASLVNAPGALTWNELQSPDPDDSAAFYGRLFGWEFQRMDGPEPYLIIENAGRRNGGIGRLPEGGGPPGWLVYFGAGDVRETHVRVAQLGGAGLTEPMDIPDMGSFAVERDPLGAVFALFGGRFDE